MKRLLCSLVFIAVTAAVCGLVSCAGTSAQKAAYTTTDALGTAVDAAWQAFDTYEIMQAQAALGKNTSKTVIKGWITSRPEWQQANQLLFQYSQAYTAWCNANAALAAGTNANQVLLDPSFQQNALAAATALSGFIARYVPNIQPIK